MLPAMIAGRHLTGIYAVPGTGTEREAEPSVGLECSKGSVAILCETG